MTCEGCKNRITIPGNYHIGCRNIRTRVQTRRWRGCGIWPLSFDENIIIECDGKDQDITGDAPSDPLLELMRLLA